MKNVKIYTDGSCLGNGNSDNFGGWAAILICDGHEKEVYGGSANTTNNRMELQAVVNGLGTLKPHMPCNIEIYTDSAYVVGGLTSWIDSWKKKGWITSNRKPVENQVIWEHLDRRISDMKNEGYTITIHKVAGHANDTYNNRADGLAVRAANEVKISGAIEILHP